MMRTAWKEPTVTDASMTSALFARLVSARQSLVVINRADDTQTDTCTCPRGRCPACHESGRQVELAKQRVDDAMSGYAGWLAAIKR